MKAIANKSPNGTGFGSNLVLDATASIEKNATKTTKNNPYEIFSELLPMVEMLMWSNVQSSGTAAEQDVEK
jgi:hypothetical protein